METIMTRLRQIFSLLLLVPAVLPFVYIGGVLYPYITPKMFLLQGIGIIELSIFAFLALKGEEFFYGRLRAKATWIPALLLIVACITSFFGIDFYRSFWGIFARGDGLLTLSVITAFFYLIILSAPTPPVVGAPTSGVGADRGFLERLVKIISAVSGLVAAIAILQWITTAFGGSSLFLPPVTGRIGSTFGNAAFLSGYLGMSLFVSLYALRSATGIWHRIFKISAILSVFAIIFAATRGAILALLIASIAALFFASWKGEGETKSNARYGLIALIVLAGLFFVFRANLSQSSFEPVRRIASISLSDGTVSSRLFVWSNILEETFQRPLLGYGAEHVAQLFDKVYDPSKILEQWFDRSHNAFLDYFAQYGVFGLALYIALIGAFSYCALRLYRREEFSLTNAGFIFLLLILTYSVQNLFVFDTPFSLWLLYALFAFLIVKLSDTQAAPLLSREIPSAVPWIISPLIAILIVPAVIIPLYANILLTNGYLYHLIDVNRANAYFEKGLSLGTYADLEYGYQAYNMYTAHQVEQLKGQDLVTAYKYALSILTANLEKYPYDARTATYLGHVMDTAPYGVAVDDAFDRQVLNRAIELSPLRAQDWYMTANISLRKSDALPQGDVMKAKYLRDAIYVLEEYAQKEPSLPVPRYILATLYYKLGDTASAKKWADEAFPLYTTPDVSAASPAVKYYLAIGDWQSAARFLMDMVADNPNDYDMLYDLAKVTYLAGDPAAAERIVAQLRIVNPEILATDENFLAAITAYESR